MAQLVRKLFLLAMLALLSACVTHYHVDPGQNQGVYTQLIAPATNDISGSYNQYSGYSSAQVYPWRSMDYFYMGYQSYQPVYFDTPYQYGYYSPWYGSYYDPWYTPWYYRPHYRYARRDPYWHHRYNRHPRRHYPGHNSYAHERNANDDRNSPGSGQGGGRDRGQGTGAFAGANENPIDDRLLDKETMGDGRNRDRQPVTPPLTSNRIVTGSSAFATDPRQEVRNRSDSKLQPSRPGPVTGNTQPVTAISSRSSYAIPVVSVQDNNSQIRRRADQKEQRSRTGPINNAPIIITAQPPARLSTQPATHLNPVVVRNNNGTSVRSRSDAKVGRSYTQPVNQPGVRTSSPPVMSRPISSPQISHSPARASQPSAGSSRGARSVSAGDSGSSSSASTRRTKENRR
jgi:hypothetical protein